MKPIIKMIVLGLATLGIQTLSRAMPTPEAVSESDELYSESIYHPKIEVEVPHALESSARTETLNEEFDALGMINETLAPEVESESDLSPKRTLATPTRSKKSRRN